MAIFEIPRLWMCYYNYMTLSLCMMNVFMIYIVVGAGLSVFSVISLMGNILNAALFMGQLALMVFTGYALWFKIGSYRAALNEYKKTGKKSSDKKDEETAGATGDAKAKK